MRKQYVVRLSEEERALLQTMIGRGAAEPVNRFETTVAGDY